MNASKYPVLSVCILPICMKLGDKLHINIKLSWPYWQFLLLLYMHGPQQNVILVYESILMSVFFVRAHNVKTKSHVLSCFQQQCSCVSNTWTCNHISSPSERCIIPPFFHTYVGVSTWNNAWQHAWLSHWDVFRVVIKCKIILKCG